MAETAHDIAIVNAAIARTGGTQIQSFTDGSAEAEVAKASYEQIVRAELTRGAWHFAEKDAALSTLAGEPLTGNWRYAYAVPSDLMKLIYVEQAGVPVDYEIVGTAIFSNAGDADMAARYIWRAPASRFSAEFVDALATRLEAVFLRANEQFQEAEVSDDRATTRFIRGRTSDDQQNPPRRIATSRLAAARRA